jgi:rhodanese-related sulfurtransferase
VKYKIIGALGIVLFAGSGFFLFGSKSPGIMEQVVEHTDSLKSFEISPSEVVRKKQSGSEAVLLDVRTLEEYEEIHLKDAILLPVQEMTQESLAAIGLGEDSKDREIILYCRSGARSSTAYNIMKSLGYTNIKSVAGGMVHWQEDQYPLTESGVYTGPSNDTSEDIQEVVSEGPRLSVDRALHDFGEIPQYGGTVETTFAINNTGTEVLEIGTLTTSCSCTSASVDDASLKPNESATLTVVFDPDFHEEPLEVFKRTVFIPTNDSNNPESEVSVQVDILEGE